MNKLFFLISPKNFPHPKAYVSKEDLKWLITSTQVSQKGIRVDISEVPI